ncbi:MAG: hypothetical protein GF383_11280 [Candidatus Lokiarchaeota archaeon]|nr:hypothetical protein [Candidatus Lokiarchaeota archaeon]MBD3341297.1 hypothetical protein [Candidatus Lokiarchaeota archaeon]
MVLRNSLTLGCPPAYFFAISSLKTFFAYGSPASVSSSKAERRGYGEVNEYHIRIPSMLGCSALAPEIALWM